jgi:hypothetical protein
MKNPTLRVPPLDASSILDQTQSQSPLKMENLVTMSSHRKPQVPSYQPHTTKHQNNKYNEQASRPILLSTDFGSKGLYKPTTTIGGGGSTSLAQWLEKN